jgi:hypothetical protein
MISPTKFLLAMKLLAEFVSQIAYFFVLGTLPRIHPANYTKHEISLSLPNPLKATITDSLLLQTTLPSAQTLPIQAHLQSNQLLPNPCPKSILRA